MGKTMEQLSYHVEWLEPSELISYEANAKLHSEKNVANIANSIKRYGWQQNITITRDKVIIIGHGRQLAALQLGVKCPCKVIEDELTDDDIRELRIADNLTHDGEYDWEAMSAEIDRFGLEFEGFDFDLGEMMEEMPGEDEEGEAQEDDYDEPLPDEPKVKRGDLFTLGRHRILCGDSTMIDDVEKLMGGAKADMLLTDPPCEIGKGAASTDDFRRFLADAYSNADMVMKPGAVFYIWYAAERAYDFLGALADVGWVAKQELVWNKNRMTLSRRDYNLKHENCSYGWKDGSEHLWASDRKQATVIDCDVNLKNDLHPTMKPVKLFDYCIRNNTKGGDVVLDLFGGSGTTILACEQNGRVGYVMELDPKYVQATILRFVQFTGKADEVLLHRGDETIPFSEIFGDEL